MCTQFRTEQNHGLSKTQKMSLGMSKTISFDPERRRQIGEVLLPNEFQKGNLHGCLTTMNFVS
jgi:hypothetical protein